MSSVSSSQKEKISNLTMIASPSTVIEDFHDGEATIIFEEGFEVPRQPTPVRMRVHTPSPSRRRNYRSPSPSCRRNKNKLLTPIRAFSFRRRKKNLVPPGPDNEATLAVRVSITFNQIDLLSRIIYATHTIFL